MGRSLIRSVALIPGNLFSITEPKFPPHKTDTIIRFLLEWMSSTSVSLSVLKARDTAANKTHINTNSACANRVCVSVGKTGAIICVCARQTVEKAVKIRHAESGVDESARAVRVGQRRGRDGLPDVRTGWHCNPNSVRVGAWGMHHGAARQVGAGANGKMSECTDTRIVPEK